MRTRTYLLLLALAAARYRRVFGHRGRNAGGRNRPQHSRAHGDRADARSGGDAVADRHARSARGGDGRARRSRRASSACSRPKAIASRAGSCIAVLDDADFRLARDRAKAYLDVAEANRAHARAEKDRADSLLKTGGITDKDHLAAQVAVQVAEASHAQARSELAIAERQLGRSQITAPISGRICKASRRRGHHRRCRHAALHDRRRLGVRVPLVGRVGRFRQGEGRRDRRRHRRCAAGIRHRRRSEPHRAAGRRAQPLVRNHHPRSRQAAAGLGPVRARAGEGARSARTASRCRRRRFCATDRIRRKRRPTSW